MKDEDGLGLAILSVQQAIISSYEDNCPLKPAKTGRHSVKWTSEAGSLRRGVRRLFNKWLTRVHKAGNSIDWLSGDMEKK